MITKARMKELPKDERPYEKCLIYGPWKLSDAELLAVILRSGSAGNSCVDLANEVLKASRLEEGLLGIYHLSMQELQRIKGVGQVKAVQIKCIGELSKRISRTGSRNKLDFNNPDTIANYYMELLRHEEQEKIICMMLDTKNQLLGDVVMTMGTVNSSLLSPRELFIEAIRFHAVHIILVHNHPSGDASPSGEDIQVTKRIQKAGELLGITLLDHIIIGDHCYSSLLEQGLT